MRGGRTWRERYAAAFETLVSVYMQHVSWEPREAIEARTAALLPGLMLARIDGKSPVEYLTTAADQDAVRAFARPLLISPVRELGAIAGRWVAAGPGGHPR